MKKDNKLKKLVIEVKNGNIDFAIKKLNKIVEKNSKLIEYMNRLYYEKPAIIRNKINSNKKKVLLNNFF